MNKYERFEIWLRENGAQFDMLELREYDTNVTTTTTTSVSAVMDDDDDEEEEKKESTTSSTVGFGNYDCTSRTDEGGTTVDVMSGDENRGVHARVHLPPNTTCMTIPRKCLITVEMGQTTPIGHKVLHADLDLDAPKHIYLMLYVLWDRKVHGRKSFFFPYYEILPRTLSNMPIFLTPEDLTELDGSYVRAQIVDRNDAIEEDYDSIVRVAPELRDLCTLQEFKWARMCVCSRNFGLQMDGHRTSALVPHADMLNHYRPRETKWTFDDEKQAFTITTLQSIPAGAQVYDSYGQKCNHRFLLNYGFAVEDNRELDGFCPNEVPLEVELSPHDDIYEQKLDFWLRGETTTSSSSSSQHDTPVSTAKRVRVCVSNNENTRLLFSLLRTYACNEEELSAVSNNMDGAAVSRALFGMGGDRGNGGAVPSCNTFYRSCRDIRHPLSVRNERAAMEQLLVIVDTALAKYPTTLSQDVAALMDDDDVTYPRFSNKRHARIQVRGEKEVLHHFRQWALVALDVLTVMEHELSSSNEDTDQSQQQQQQQRTFEYVIRQMEEEEGGGSSGMSPGGSGGLHHTIVRYCADVLGSLRREEMKNIRRKASFRL